MPRWVPLVVRRFWFRHEIAVKVGGVALGALVAIALMHDTTRHPTREDVLRHVIASYEVGQAPRLSAAEQRALAPEVSSSRLPASSWNDVEVTPATPVSHLDRPGTLPFRLGYDDGYFDVSDVRWRSRRDDPDPIDATSKTGSVVGGGPGQAMVAACCEEGDAGVRLVLRRAAPRAPAAGWREMSDVDLDLATGRLAFTTTSGTERVVTVPRGRYRMRVSDVAAAELEQAEERFRIELWPRAADGPLRIWRVAHPGDDG